MSLRRRAPGGGASPLSSHGSFAGLSLDLNSVLDNIPVQVAPDRHPQLWLGSKHAAFSEVTLLERNITHVLNVSTREPCLYPHQFTYLHIDIRDHSATDILSCLPAASVFIKAGLHSGGVLVHCNGGRSRSASVVIAFLMSTLDMDYDQVLAQLKAARSTIAPNKGFEMQLRAFSEARHNVFGAHQLLLKRRIDAYFGHSGASMSMSQSGDDFGMGRAGLTAGPGSRTQSTCRAFSSSRSRIGAPGDASGADTPTAADADAGAGSVAPALDLRPPRLAMSAPDMPGGFVAITPSRTLHRHIHCSECKEKLLLTVSVMHHSPTPGGRKLVKRGSDSSPRASRGKRARRRRGTGARSGERRMSSGAGTAVSSSVMLSSYTTTRSSVADSMPAGTPASLASGSMPAAAASPSGAVGQTFEKMVVLDTSPHVAATPCSQLVQSHSDDMDGPPSAGVGTVEFSFGAGLMPRSTSMTTTDSDEDDSHGSRSSDSSHTDCGAGGAMVGVGAALSVVDSGGPQRRRRRRRHRLRSTSHDAATSAPIELYFSPRHSSAASPWTSSRHQSGSGSNGNTGSGWAGAGAGAGAGTSGAGVLASPAFGIGSVGSTVTDGLGAFGTVVPHGSRVRAPSAPRGRSRGSHLLESPARAPAQSLGAAVSFGGAQSAGGGFTFGVPVAGDAVDVEGSSDGSVSVDMDTVPPALPAVRGRVRWGKSDDRAGSSAMVSGSVSSRRGLSTFGGSSNSLQSASRVGATPLAFPPPLGPGPLHSHTRESPLHAVWNSAPGVKTPRLAAHSASPLGRPPSPELAPARVPELVHIDNPRMAHAQFSHDMKLLAGDSHHPALEMAAEFASEDVAHAAKLTRCQYVFVEPLPWMGDLTSTDRQTIRCKGCASVIGEYCVHGHQCSCGRFVEGPCIRLSTDRLRMSDLGHAGPSMVRARTRNPRKPPKHGPPHPAHAPLVAGVAAGRHPRQPVRSTSLVA